MPPLVKSEFYSFTPTIRTNFNISLIDYVVGIIGNATLLILWWKNRRIDSDRFSALVISVDLLCIGKVVIEIITHFLEGFNDDHLGSGENYCIAMGLLCYATCNTSLIAITIYAYQRYCIILNGKPFSISFCFFVVGLSFILFILLITTPLMLGIQLMYFPAGTYCMVDWLDRSMIVIFFIFLSGSIQAFCLASICFMYYKILKHTKEVTKILMNKDVSIFKNSTACNGSAVTKDYLANERTLIRRVVIIVLVMIACYLPYLLGVLYFAILGTPVSPFYDAFSAGMFVANGLFDFVVFVATNSTYKRALLDVFRFHSE